jgi:[ribosomal protein S18]-alanine N-acetyltransferase
MSSLVRPMTAADLQAVTELDALSFKAPWPPKAFETELANTDARCWVAEDHGQVAAVLVLWRVLDEAHIATLAVHPEFRRRGIAGRLLQAGMDEAYAEGARIYHLEVRSGNVVAQKLYQDFGFEIVGRRPKYYKDTGEDAVLMTKVVS